MDSENRKPPEEAGRRQSRRKSGAEAELPQHDPRLPKQVQNLVEEAHSIVPRLETVEEGVEDPNSVRFDETDYDAWSIDGSLSGAGSRNDLRDTDQLEDFEVLRRDSETEELEDLTGNNMAEDADGVAANVPVDGAVDQAGNQANNDPQGLPNEMPPAERVGGAGGGGGLPPGNNGGGGQGHGPPHPQPAGETYPEGLSEGTIPILPVELDAALLDMESKMLTRSTALKHTREILIFLKKEENARKMGLTEVEAYIANKYLSPRTFRATFWTIEAMRNDESGCFIMITQLIRIREIFREETPKLVTKAQLEAAADGDRADLGAQRITWTEYTARRNDCLRLATRMSTNWQAAKDEAAEELKNGKKKLGMDNWQILEYYKCEEKGCLWTVAGFPRERDSRPQNFKVCRPHGQMEGSTEFNKLDYLIEEKAEDGRTGNDGDPADDGYGDAGRLERYRDMWRAHREKHHKNSVKDMINIDPPKFRMNMTDHQWREEKLQWERYNIKNPPGSSAMRFEMMKRSMSRELSEVMDNYMKKMGDVLSPEQVEGFFQDIEDNAVETITHEEHLRALTDIKQDANEKIQPFLSRIRAAAQYVEMDRHGVCTEASHKAANNMEDAEGKKYPCKQGRIWENMWKDFITNGKDILTENNKARPACCKAVRDEIRVDWMIKQQFVMKMYSDKLRRDIYHSLAEAWHRTNSKGKFDIMKCPLTLIVETAKRIEELDKNNNLQMGGANLRKQQKKTTAGQPKKADGKPRAKISNGCINGKCCSCGKEPHGTKQADGSISNTKEDREKHCPAMKKKCGTCDKIGHLRSVCQSKTQQNAGGQGNTYNKQSRNAKGQQMKQGGNKPPGIQAGGATAKQEESKTEENPTHQQALDYWKMAHQVKEMGGTRITPLTEGRRATFAEVVKFGHDHSTWKEGDPILWKASGTIKTQNLAMGGLTLRGNRRGETSSDWDTDDSDDWTVVNRRNRRSSGAKETNPTKGNNKHQDDRTDQGAPPSNMPRAAGQLADQNRETLFREDPKKNNHGKDNRRGAGTRRRNKGGRKSLTQSTLSSHASMENRGVSENPRNAKQTIPKQDDRGRQDENKENRPPRGADELTAASERISREIEVWREEDTWAYQQLERGKWRHPHAKWRGEIDSRGVSNITLLAEASGNFDHAVSFGRDEPSYGERIDEMGKALDLISSHLEAMMIADKAQELYLRHLIAKEMDRIRAPEHLKDLCAVERLEDVMSTMSVKKAKATRRREVATDMLYKIFIPEGSKKRDKEVANSTSMPWKNQGRTIHGESRDEINTWDCGKTKLSVMSKLEQRNMKANMTRETSWRWLANRGACKHPLQQSCEDDWGKKGKDGAYRYRVKIRTKHFPCKKHMQEGMEPGEVIDFKDTPDLINVIRGDEPGKGVTSKAKLNAGAADIDFRGLKQSMDRTKKMPPHKRKGKTKPTNMAGLTINMSSMTSLEGKRRGIIEHAYYDNKTKMWKEGARPHRMVDLDWTVDRSTYTAIQLVDPAGEGMRPTKKITSVVDTGTQCTAIGRREAEAMGIDISKLAPVMTDVGSIAGEKLTPLGSFYVSITGTLATQYRMRTIEAKDIAYVFEETPHPFISLSVAIQLGICKETMNVGDHLEMGGATTFQEEKTGEPEEERQICNEMKHSNGDRACDCPEREDVPEPPEWKGEFTQREIPAMRKMIFKHYASSALNVCKLQPQPIMEDRPPVRLEVNEETYVPRRFTQAGKVPLHLEDAVRAALEADVRAGVIARVPAGVPNTGTARQVIVQKPSEPGKPPKIRRTVDFSWLNKHINPTVYHCDPPLTQAQRVPSECWKTVIDARDGFHSIPVHQDSWKWLHFITPEGRFGYKNLPQGMIISPAVYMESMAMAESDEEGKTCFPHSTRLMDDTCLWAWSIENNFRNTCRYITQVGRAGISFSPKKIQFCQKEIDYVGYRIGEDGIKVSPKILDSIRSFERPDSLKKMRSFMGLVEQTSPFLRKANELAPFRHLLKATAKEEFLWTPEMAKAFEHAKNHIIQETETGIRRYDKGRRTKLACDWSKDGMGCIIQQKYCGCESDKSDCCEEGWKLVLTDSRRCTPAEANYAPIEGEAAAVNWALTKFRYFLLAHPDLIVEVDHQPLLGVLNGQKDMSEIINHRIVELARKINLFQPFRIRHVPGIKNLAADAGSRAPAGTKIDPKNKKLMVTGAGLFIRMGAAEIMEEATMGTPELKRTRAFLGLQLASLNMRASKSKTVDLTPEEEELEIIMNREDRELIESKLEMGTGHISRSPRAVTKERIQEAAVDDPVYRAVRTNLTDKLPWGPDCEEYQRERKNLFMVDKLIMFKNRVVIPKPLRKEVLSLLHIGHQGTTSRLARVEETLWWPNLRDDLESMRKACEECQENQPSQPKEPPKTPESPAYPFQKLHSDYFQLAGKHFLLLVDAFSGFPFVYEAAHGGTAEELKKHLMDCFTTYGIPEELMSDGGPQYTSGTISQFLKDWGVRHRISSAYNPHSNLRAETGVKSMKRILREAIGSGGGIDGMSARAALMEYRSTPQRDLKHSPAELLFGRAVRDLLQLQEGKWLQDPRYLLTAEEREEKYAEKLKREGAKWAEHTRTLEPLNPGDDVLVQCHAGAQKGKWTKSGRIVQKVGESSYVVRYDGTGRASKRNRTHLRKMTVAPTSVTEHETSAIRRTNEDGTRAPGAEPTQDSERHSWEETNGKHSPKEQMSQGPDIRQTQHLAVSCKVEDRGATRVKQEPEEELDDLWAQPIWTNPDIPQWQLATSRKARRQGKRELDNLVSDLTETSPAQAKRKSVKPSRLTVGGLTLAGLTVEVKPGGKEAKEPWVTYPLNRWIHRQRGMEDSPWPTGLPCPPHVEQVSQHQGGEDAKPHRDSSTTLQEGSSSGSEQEPSHVPARHLKNAGHVGRPPVTIAWPCSNTEQVGDPTTVEYVQPQWWGRSARGTSRDMTRPRDRPPRPPLPRTVTSAPSTKETSTPPSSPQARAVWTLKVEMPRSLEREQKMKTRVRYLVEDHGGNTVQDSMVIHPEHLKADTMIYCPIKWPTVPYSKPSTPLTSTKTADSMESPRSDPNQPRDTCYQTLMQQHAQETEKKWKFFWNGKEASPTQSWERKGGQESLAAAAMQLLKHPESLKRSVRALAQRYGMDMSQTSSEEEEPSQQEGHPLSQVDKAEPKTGSPGQTKKSKGPQQGSNPATQEKKKLIIMGTPEQDRRSVAQKPSTWLLQKLTQRKPAQSIPDIRPISSVANQENRTRKELTEEIYAEPRVGVKWAGQLANSSPEEPAEWTIASSSTCSTGRITTLSKRRRFLDRVSRRKRRTLKSSRREPKLTSQTAAAEAEGTQAESQSQSVTGNHRAPPGGGMMQEGSKTKERNVKTKIVQTRLTYNKENDVTQRKRNNSESSLKSEASTKAISSDEHTEEIRAMTLEEEERNDTLSELASSVHPQRTTMSGISMGRPATRAPSNISQATFNTAQDQANLDNQAFNQLQHQESIYPNLPMGDVVSSVAASDLRFQQKMDTMNQGFGAPSALSGFSRNSLQRSTIGGRPTYGSGINMGRASILSAPSQHPVVMRPPSTVHPSDSASNVIGISENGDPSLIYVPLKQLSQEQQMDEFRKQAHAVWVENGGRSVVTQQQNRPYDDEDGWIFNEITGMFHRAQNVRPHHGHDGRQGQPGRGPPLGQWNMDKELGDIGRKKNPPPGERRGAPQDGAPNQAQASVTDAGSGSGTPASERAQVKVAGWHWFSCTPSSIAKMWVRTLIMLILTVGLIVLLLIFGNQLGLLKLK